MMNDAERAQYLRQKDFPLGVEQFSDTFVFYAPLGNAEGELLVLPVYAILGACFMAMQMSLAGKVPLRGGIHIGSGLKSPDLSFYGPALAVAHHLENEIAQYPRIVVSSAVAAFVQHTPAPIGCPRIDQWRLDMLQMCRDMLYKDGSDGQVIVDWLGNGARRLHDGEGDDLTISALRKAHDFVGQMATEFEQRSIAENKPNDVKLARRYSLLYQYMLARLPDWGVKFVDDAPAPEEE
jgi:hypothetical protein